MAENVDPETLGRVTENEIESQPLCWQKAHRQGLEDPVGLPHTGERVLVLGCGTSYYLAAAYAWLREQAGHGATDALVASELPPRLRAYDRVVAISRSGSTVEVLQALSKLPAGMPTTGILGGLDTPVASAVTQVVDVSYADERSVVQTRFPTTVLTLLRTHIGASSDEISELIRRAEAVVREPVTTPGPRQLVVLATGWGPFSLRRLR